MSGSELDGPPEPVGVGAGGAKRPCGALPAAGPPGLGLVVPSGTRLAREGLAQGPVGLRATPLPRAGDSGQLAP